MPTHRFFVECRQIPGLRNAHQLKAFIELSTNAPDLTNVCEAEELFALNWINEIDHSTGFCLPFFARPICEFGQ
ncbi:hypothetical protein D3C86_1937840 [compost metagenome]